jgi:hypothetical protein
MDESIKHVVIGITLAFVVGAAYILEMKLNDVYRDGLNRDKELSFLKVKVEYAESELKTALESVNNEISLLKTAIEELADEIKKIKNTSPGKYTVPNDYHDDIAVVLSVEDLNTPVNARSETQTRSVTRIA